MFVEVDRLRTHVEQAGAGPPVLLLHGWGSSVRAMAPIMQSLAPSYAVTALDLPGHGTSAMPPCAWGNDDYAGFVEHAMARLAIDRAHLLGHSRGGAISIVIAARSPACVDRLVLVDSAGIRAPRTWQLRLKGWAARTGRRLLGHRRAGPGGQRLLAALYSRLGMADYRDAGPMRATFVKLVNEDVSPLLPCVQAPALVVWGARDRDAPLWMGQQMARQIPGAGLVVLAQSGHFPFLDERAAFDQAVLNFLADSPR